MDALPNGCRSVELELESLGIRVLAQLDSLFGGRLRLWVHVSP